MLYLNKEKGSALITALMLTVIVVASVTIVILLQNVLLFRTKQAEMATQAFEISTGVESWASVNIANYLNLSDAGASTISWPLIMKPVNMEDAKVTATLEDIQYLYNLNQVPSDIQGFSNLIHYADPNINYEEAKALAQRVAAWQSKAIADYTAEDNSEYYAKKTPPYHKAYLPFSDKSELQLVRGFDTGLYYKLSPYVIALPVNGIMKVNANTAREFSFMTISNKISPQMAQDIIAARKDKGGFKTTAEFFDVPSIKKEGITTDRVGLKSQYFLLKTRVDYEGLIIQIESVYEAKKTEEGNNAIRVLYRVIVPS